MSDHYGWEGVTSETCQTTVGGGGRGHANVGGKGSCQKRVRPLWVGRGHASVGGKGSRQKRVRPLEGGGEGSRQCGWEGVMPETCQTTVGGKGSRQKRLSEIDLLSPVAVINVQEIQQKKKPPLLVSTCPKSLEHSLDLRN